MAVKTVIAPQVKKPAVQQVKKAAPAPNSSTVPLLSKPAPKASFLQTTGSTPVKKGGASSWVFNTPRQKKTGNSESGSSALGNPGITQRFLKAVTPEGASRPKAKAPVAPAGQPVSKKPAPQPPVKSVKPGLKDNKDKKQPPVKKNTGAVIPAPKQPAVKEEKLKAPVKNNNNAAKDLLTGNVPHKVNSSPGAGQAKEQSAAAQPKTIQPVKSVNNTKGNPNAVNNPDTAKQGEERSKNVMNKELQEARQGGRTEVSYEAGKPTVVKPNSTALSRIQAAEKKSSMVKPAQPVPKAVARPVKKVTPPARKKPAFKKAAAPKAAPKSVKPAPAAKEEKLDLQKHVPNQPLTVAQVGQSIQRGEHKTGKAQVQQRLAQSSNLAAQSVTKLKAAATQKKTIVTGKKNAVISQIAAQAQQHEQATETLITERISQLQQTKEEKTSALDQSHQDTIQQHTGTTTANRENGHNSLQDKKKNFRQRVQTLIRLPAPLTSARTDCRLGSKRRRVLLFAWETLLPNCGPLPQSSQRLAIITSEFLLVFQLVLGSVLVRYR